MASASAPPYSFGTWTACRSEFVRQESQADGDHRVRGVGDVPRPRPAVDDLARLVPAIVPLDGADAELVAIGERYGALAGFAPDLGTPVRCEKAKDIDTAGWGHQIYAVAAAGVRAVVAGRVCPRLARTASLRKGALFVGASVAQAQRRATPGVDGEGLCASGLRLLRQP